MADNPLISLADKIAERLAAEGLVDPKRVPDISSKIALGKMSEDDWFFEIERTLAKHNPPTEK